MDGVTTSKVDLDVRPLSPTIGAEIHGSTARPTSTPT